MSTLYHYLLLTLIVTPLYDVDEFALAVGSQVLLKYVSTDGNFRPPNVSTT